MQKRPVKINDPALRDTLGRLDAFSRMLARRLDELSSSLSAEPGVSTRSDCTIAAIEAEVAMGLVESASYEVSLRLLAHGVVRDAAKDIAPRRAKFAAVLGRFESVFGAIPRA